MLSTSAVSYAPVAAPVGRCPYRQGAGTIRHKNDRGPRPFAATNGGHTPLRYGFAPSMRTSGPLQDILRSVAAMEIEITAASSLCQGTFAPPHRLLIGGRADRPDTSPAIDGRSPILALLPSVKGGDGKVVCMGGVGPRPRQVERALLGDVADDGNTCNDVSNTTAMARPADTARTVADEARRPSAMRPFA